MTIAKKNDDHLEVKNVLLCRKIILVKIKDNENRFKV